MLLRTRLTLLVTVSMGLLFAGFIGAGLNLRQLHQGHLGEVATAGEAALWQQMLRDEGNALAAYGSALADNPDLLRALAARDRAGLRDAAAPGATAMLARHGLSDLQILDREGALLFAVSSSAEPQRILDAGTIDVVLAGASPQGLRQVSSDRFVVAAALTLQQGGQSVGVLTLAAPAARLVRRFAAANGAESYLVSLRGRMVHGTDEALWRAAEVTVPARRGSVTKVTLGEASYTVTGVPLSDMAAGSAGVLVTIREATANLRAADQVAQLAVAGALAIGLLSLGGLFLMLGRAFRPLDQAIAVLQALARGDTGVTLGVHGDDEIGRIAGAVRAYHRDARAMAEARRHRELQRRRQERFIRGQMIKLADALPAQDRRQLLADLDQIVEQRAARAADVGDDEQLGLLAAVMRELSARVVQQHRQLEEALVRETKLAGLEQELAIARQIQTTILPVAYVDGPVYGVFGRTVPAREVGGDFYDFFEIDDRRLGILVADVSGKGVPAAFFMAIARTLMRALAVNFDAPGRCLAKVNETLSRNNPEQLFVTLFYGILDLESGVLRYANGGHNSPVLIGARGLKTLALTDGIPLGILDDYGYEEAAITLRPGDLLLLYSDGIPDATNAAGAFYGMDSWLEQLSALWGRPLDQVVESIIAGVGAYTGDVEPADDVTCLALELRGVRTAPTNP